MKTSAEDFESTPLFTEHLEETRHRVEPFTALKWLQSIDMDSLNMLQGYIDNFDERTSMEEVVDNEVIDMFRLVNRIIDLETGLKEWEPDRPDQSKCIEQFCAMVVLASMQRKGFIKATGDGKLTDNLTTYELTAQGQEAQLVLEDEGKIRKKS
jgi:hypothetical protein